jgi:hypothetical protein
MILSPYGYKDINKKREVIAKGEGFKEIEFKENSKFRDEGGLKVKKVLILAISVTVLLFSFSIAGAEWEYTYPNTSLVFPYFNATSGFQTFIMVSQEDTDGEWGQSSDSPNVVVKFNPKCGRGESRSFSLTTKQSFVVTPPQAIEGWVEAFVKSDIADESADEDYPLAGIAIILDIGNGVAYHIESIGYYDYLCVDGADEPLFYGWECDAGNSDENTWGFDIENPIVARLWRNSDYGRTMFVLCDPSGRHLANDIPNPLPAAGWLPSALYVPNKGQLDIYSKSETDAHLSVEWCTGADAGKPGIVTIGVGTTAGPLGTTDTSIANPAATMTDAPYGFGQAYNLRTLMWVDANADGLMQVGEDYDESDLLGAVLTRISNVYFPHAIHSQQMICKWLEYNTW